MTVEKHSFTGLTIAPVGPDRLAAEAGSRVRDRSRGVESLGQVSVEAAASLSPRFDLQGKG